MRISDNRRWLVVLAGLMLLGAAFYPAAAKKKPKPVYVIVGKVKSTTNRILGDRKLTVRVGGRSWMLHVQKNARIVHAGRPVSVHNIDLGTWVKATGPQIGKTRQRTDRLDIIGTHGAYKKSKVYKADQAAGYAIVLK